MNFKERIVARIGLNLDSETSNITEYLNNSIVDVINKVKAVNPDAYSRMGTKTEVDANATAVIDGDIIAVYGAPKANAGGGATYRRPATEVPFELSELAKDSSSIHYQSGYSPGWYRDGRSIGIIPEGGIVLHINIPTTSWDAQDIYSMPKQFSASVVLGACVQTVERKILNLLNDMPTLDPVAWPSDPVFTTTLPADLTAPTFSWTATDIEDEFDGHIIDATLVRASFPVYVSPTLDTVTLTGLNDLNLPEPPSVPSALQNALNFTETVPVYQQQALEVVPFPADITALDLSSIAVPAAIDAPAIVSQTFNKNNIEALPAPPVFVKPKLLGTVKDLMEDAPLVDATIKAEVSDATDLNEVLGAYWNYIAKEEDVELANAASSWIGQVTNLYNAALGVAQQEFNQAQTEYQATIARQTEVVKLAQADDQQQKNHDFQAATSQYDRELQQHNVAMAEYNAKINEATSTWQSNNMTWKMAQWNSEQGHKFQEFSNRMSDAMNKFNTEMSAYEKKWGEAVKDVEISNLNYGNIMQQFEKELSQYQQQVSKLTQEYQQNEVLKKWEKYKFDSQQNLSKFQAQITDNMNTFNEQNTVLSTEMQIAQTNAGNAQSALMAKMTASTDLAKNNEAQRLAQELQTWQAELSNYQNLLGKYTSETSTEVSRFQANMSSASNKMGENMNKFNTSFQKFQQEQQAWEKMLGILKQEYSESVGVMIKQGE